MSRTCTPQRLERIVDAATDVFGRVGYEGARLDAIARVAGVSVGSIYNYVNGKKALPPPVAQRAFGHLAPRRFPGATPRRSALLRAMRATLDADARVEPLETA